MCDFEEKWLTNAKISPSFWNRYVDDTFTMFHNQDSANEFLHYLNGCHSNIKFTIEFEQNNAIPFLDILITRNQNSTFMTSIYRKRTFTGLYTKWDSFTPRKYKINLIRSLTYRYNRLCSSGSLLQSALHDLRKLLLLNGYPQGIINYHINDVLNKNRHQHSNPVSTVPKKDIIILLPYLGLQSNQVASAKRLKSCVYKFYSCVNLKIVFQSSRCIKSFFPYKDRIVIVHNNPELFTEQIAGIVMVFISVKLNGGFTIEKPNILRSSLKMTILQPLLTTSRPLDTTSSGIILIF